MLHGGQVSLKEGFEVLLRTSKSLVCNLYKAIIEWKLYFLRIFLVEPKLMSSIRFYQKTFKLQVLDK
jgi:hypothetical protein